MPVTVWTTIDEFADDVRAMTAARGGAVGLSPWFTEAFDTRHGGKPLKIKAIAYLRTSSAANVGADKDSEKRQRAAIAAFAKAHGYEVVESFYDAAVSGAGPCRRAPWLQGDDGPDRQQRRACDYC